MPGHDKRKRAARAAVMKRLGLGYKLTALVMLICLAGLAWVGQPGGVDASMAGDCLCRGRSAGVGGRQLRLCGSAGRSDVAGPPPETRSAAGATPPLMASVGIGAASTARRVAPGIKQHCGSREGSVCRAMRERKIKRVASIAPAQSGRAEPPGGLAAHARIARARPIPGLPCHTLCHARA